MVVHRRGLAQHHRDNAKDRDARARDCEVSESHLLPRIDGGWTGNPLSTPGRALMAGLARVVLFGLNNAASVGCTPGYEALGAAYLPARSCRSGWSDVLRPRGGAAAEQSRVWFFFSAWASAASLARACACTSRQAKRNRAARRFAGCKAPGRASDRGHYVIRRVGRTDPRYGRIGERRGGCCREPGLGPSYFQKATSSFRARATIVVLRTRPPSRLTRSRYHWASAECGR
jgi:hypothetical protein